MARPESRCDSCGLFRDVVLRHVPLKDGNWICWYCLQHAAVQKQYSGRLAVTLKGAQSASVEAVTPRSKRPCALGRLCLNVADKKPAAAKFRQKYCSEGCRGRADFYRQHPERMAAARMVEV